MALETILPTILRRDSTALEALGPLKYPSLPRARTTPQNYQRLFQPKIEPKNGVCPHFEAGMLLILFVRYREALTGKEASRPTNPAKAARRWPMSLSYYAKELSETNLAA